MPDERKSFDDEDTEVLPANPAEARAEEAMRPVVDTPAGSAEGVGSVRFNDPGVFEIGAADDADETERQAPGA